MGDGKKIQLFHDAWLPNSNAGRIIFHKGILAQTAKTNGLIDSNSGWWNLGLIDQCFYPPDAQCIIAQTFCTTPQADTFVSEEDQGEYGFPSYLDRVDNGVYSIGYLLHFGKQRT